MVYVLFQGLAQSYFAVFLLLGIPIGLLALALAFLKIQEQPLTHFIIAGLSYLTQPKIRIWQRRTALQSILTAPVKEKPVAAPSSRHLGKSELEQLAYNLDTYHAAPKEEKQIGRLAAAFEQLLREQPKAKT